MAKGACYYGDDRDQILARTWTGDTSCYNCDDLDVEVCLSGNGVWFTCPKHKESCARQQYVQFRWKRLLTISGEIDG